MKIFPIVHSQYVIVQKFSHIGENPVEFETKNVRKWQGQYKKQGIKSEKFRDRKTTSVYDQYHKGQSYKTIGGREKESVLGIRFPIVGKYS